MLTLCSHLVLYSKHYYLYLILSHYYIVIPTSLSLDLFHNFHHLLTTSLLHFHNSSFHLLFMLIMSLSLSLVHYYSMFMLYLHMYLSLHLSLLPSNLLRMFMVHLMSSYTSYSFRLIHYYLSAMLFMHNLLIHRSHTLIMSIIMHLFH